jgi:hypothetical protein
MAFVGSLHPQVNINLTDALQMVQNGESLPTSEELYLPFEKISDVWTGVPHILASSGGRGIPSEWFFFAPGTWTI